MARNLVFEDGDSLTLAVISGTVSGSPVVYGNQPGLALTDRATDGTATVKLSGVVELTLSGATAQAGVYINPLTSELSLTDTGDRVYFGTCIRASDAANLCWVRIGGIEPGSGS